MPAAGKDNVSKPSHGVIKEHVEKDAANISKPSHGGTPHPEKGAYDEKHGRAGLSKPSHGGTPHKEKADGKNRTEPLSNPGSGYTEK